jgi:hypothetical protein
LGSAGWRTTPELLPQFYITLSLDPPAGGLPLSYSRNLILLSAWIRRLADYPWATPAI